MFAVNNLKIAFCGALCAVSSMTMAAEETANLSVTALVADSCTLTATALAFGTLDTSSTSDELTAGSIVVLCTGSRTGASVALGAGQNFSGTRRMAGANGGFMPYAVHSDAGHSNAIGNGANIFSGNITAAVPQVIPVYGQIPAGSYSAGLYSDTILVTLTH